MVIRNEELLLKAAFDIGSSHENITMRI